MIAVWQRQRKEFLVFWGELSELLLTHFMLLVSFDTPWKHQKTFGDIERDQWHEMS